MTPKLVTVSNSEAGSSDSNIASGFPVLDQTLKMRMLRVVIRDHVSQPTKFVVSISNLHAMSIA